MANEFVIKNGYLSKADSQITGSLNVSVAVSASNTPNTVGFYGTASWAESSSQAATASYLLAGGTYNITSSWAQSASNAISSSYAFSSSYTLSSSYALSASYVNLLAGPNITINYQTNGIAITGSGGGTPGGSNTQIQFNSASVFNGSSNLSFDYTNNNLLVTGSIRLSGSQYFSTTDAGVSTTGQIGWNPGDQTLDLGLSGSAGNIPLLQIGQQVVARVYNAQGTTITKGQVVYVSGSQGNRIAVKLAAATDDPNSAGTLGFVLDDIANGDEGYVITEGPIYKLNTTGYTVGALIYLSSSAGQYTQTKPVAPIHEVRLGYVERVDNNVGSIYVKVDNGYEIDELHNVLITAPSSSGDLLVLSSSLWINSKQLTGSYGLTGSLGITGSLILSGSLSTNDGVSVQTITASIVSASSNIITNTITASIVSASQFTGSLFGTSSWAFSASNAINAQTASFLTAGTYLITSSWAQSASQALTASYVNPLNQNVIITGSVFVSQNITGSRMLLSSSNGTISGSTLIVYGSGSAQSVLAVQGSQGELFSITDSLSGSLFSVNDISGLPIVEVLSDNRVLLGNYQAPALITSIYTSSIAAGSYNLYSLPTSSYDGFWFEYTVRSGSNARAGQMMGIWSGSSVNYTEMTTNNFGTTTAINFMSTISSGNMIISSSTSTAGWTIKGIVRSI